MSLHDELRSFIAADVLRGVPVHEVGEAEPLISSGRVDSMGLLQILGFVEERFGVDLLATCGPDDLDSVASMATAIQRIKPVAGQA